MRTYQRILTGALGVLALAAVGCGGVAESRHHEAGHLHETDGWRIDSIGMLRELHARMVSERLPLREAQVVSAVVHDRAVTLTVAPGRAVWSLPGTSTVPAAPAVYTVTALPQAEADYWRTAVTPVAALAVVAGTELLAIAPTADVGGEIGRLDLVATGPLFLARAANDLANTEYSPVPAVIDHCGDPTLEHVAGTARAALMDYFGILGATPEEVAVGSQSDLYKQAEELAAQAARTIDEVTGDVVGVSPNDLLEQLSSGIKPEDLRYEPTVPVTVDVAGLAPTGHEAPADQAVVLVDSETRKVLGWLPIVAEWTTEGEGQPVPDFAVTAEIRRPAPGSTVGVLLRELDGEEFDCPPEETVVQWHVTVPYDAIAGSRRATISLQGRSYAAHGRS